MKKELLIFTAAVLALACVLCGLWIYEKDDTPELEDLCRYGAAASLAGFEKYAETGDGSEYIYAVADFNVFMKAWLALEGESSPEYTWCNSVYGSMVLEPEHVQENMDKLLEAMRLISADYTDPNGYIKMSELNNVLAYG